MTSRLSRITLEWLLLLILSLALSLRTVPRAWRSLNTDFPNLYLTARLAYEHVDTSRAYEWIWLQRQKDHRSVDQPIIGLVPITPFSTLPMYPLARLGALGAKRVWLVIQGLLLAPVLLCIRSITGQPLRRIALLTVICFPFHRNLLYGQFYFVILALLSGACLAQQRRRSALAGSLIAVAAAAKVFPVIFLFYFLRKKDWRALVSALLTGTIAAAVSIEVFGWNMHRIYFHEILPWTLRGEALPPFALSTSSITTLLHCLFVYEPQWNPHPWHNVPLLLSILQPLLQALILAPALLFVDALDRTPHRIALEFSALLTASLSISTLPASYHFTLLILPAAVLCAHLFPHRPWTAAVAALLYLGICYPGWNTSSASGLHVLLHTPRLYLLLALTALFYSLLGQDSFRDTLFRNATLRWSAGIAIVTAFSILTGLRRQKFLYSDYLYRIPERSDILLAAAPQAASDGPARIAMLPNRYHILTSAPVPPLRLNAMGGRRDPDQLAFASNANAMWIETVDSESRLTRSDVEGPVIHNAESPALAPDGQHIAYLRPVRGRGRLFVSALTAPAQTEIPITPDWIDVEEATFAPDGSLVISAIVGSDGSALFHIVPGRPPQAIPVGEARYPAVSPNGHWIDYSGMQSGVWNLYLLDLRTGLSRRLSTVACNQIQPAWEPDSKTLLYASDCGRALWFTAICRRQVGP